MSNVKYEERWLLEYVDLANNHDKFYEAFYIPSTNEHLCVLHWGRRGGKGQVQVHRGQPGAMRGVYESKRDAKLKGGYEQVASDGPGYLSDQLMDQVEHEVTLTHYGETAEVTTLVLTPQRVQIEMSTFVQDLLGCQSVTPAMVGQRSKFLEQMEDLKRAIAEAEATAELMDTVYGKRLS